MDPISLAVIAGMVYFGRQVSQQQSEEEANEIPADKAPDFNIPQSRVMDTYTGTGSNGVGVFYDTDKCAVPSFGVIGQVSNPFGAPVTDLRDRMFVSGKMNNLAPVGQMQVGPGLGVDASVPATGGFHQLYRILPNNTGAYRLTTLPGRIVPGKDQTGGRAPSGGSIGELTHFAPAKTAFLPTRRPNVGGRAQGQGGALTGAPIREHYEKTKRTTARAENSLRNDGLNFGPAKRLVSGLTLAMDPTRNKADQNDQVYQYTNLPAPGISSFIGGYTNNPINKALEMKHGSGPLTTGELMAAGLRPDDRRQKENRMGNMGRMNVRENALNTIGLPTQVRIDTNGQYDFYTGPQNGQSAQNYVGLGITKESTTKGMANPWASQMDIHKKQLQSNPFAKSLAF